MDTKEKDLRVEIVKLREKLLFSEGQFFYMIFHFLKKMIARPDRITPPSALAKSSKKQEYESLAEYKNKLLQITHSPFMLFVWVVTALRTLIFFIPDKTREYKLNREFINFKQSDFADVINFGVIPYNFRKLRQQHLVENLAKTGHRIFYIENRFKVENKPGFTVYKKKKNIYIVKLHCQRDIAIYHQIPTAKEIKFINASLDKLMLYARINNPVAKIDYPFWAYLQAHEPMPLIYDCMDDYEGFDITGKHIIRLEKDLVKKADLTLVCSNILMSKILKLKPIRSVLIKNACDFEHFVTAKKITCKIPSDLPPKKRKIIGFFGAVGEWIDAVLLREIAQRFKDAQIVIIGQIQNKEVVALQNLPNMWLLGEKPYNILPDYLQWFDVCIIPFKISKHTTLIDPVKLYEYFASGKPVVTTAVAEIEHFQKLLYYSDSRKKFLDNVQTALLENNSSLRKKRQEAAENNTWDKRAKLLHAWIQKLT